MTSNIPHPYPDGAAENWIAGQHISWSNGTNDAEQIADCYEMNIADDHP